MGSKKFSVLFSSKTLCQFCRGCRKWGVHRKKIGAVAVWWLDDDERTTTGVDSDDRFWDTKPGSSAEPTDASQTDEYLVDALADE